MRIETSIDLGYSRIKKQRRALRFGHPYDTSSTCTRTIYPTSVYTIYDFELGGVDGEQVPVGSNKIFRLGSFPPKKRRADRLHQPSGISPSCGCLTGCQPIRARPLVKFRRSGGIFRLRSPGGGWWWWRRLYHGVHRTPIPRTQSGGDAVSGTFQISSIRRVDLN